MNTKIENVARRKTNLIVICMVYIYIYICCENNYITQIII